MNNAPASNNTTWGFWGTIADTDRDVQVEWTKAFNFIKALGAKVDNKTVTDDEVRGFLDSKAGRHLADGVISMGTIEAVHARWSIIGKGLWFTETIRAFRQEAW